MSKQIEPPGIFDHQILLTGRRSGKSMAVNVHASGMLGKPFHQIPLSQLNSHYPDLMAPSFNYWITTKKDFRGYRQLNGLSIDQVAEGASVPVHEVVAFDMGVQPGEESMKRLKKFIHRRDLDAFENAVNDQRAKQNKALRLTMIKLWVVLAATIWTILSVWRDKEWIIQLLSSLC